MSIEIEEKLGRRIGDSNAERRYLVRGSTNDVEIEDTVANYAPASITLTNGRTLPRQQIEVEELTTDPPLWLATVSYGRSTGAGEDPGQDGQTSFNFETRGGTQRITQSLATVASYPSPTASWAPPNHGRAINVTGNGPEGVDVMYPVFNFNITRLWDTITSNYVATLFNLTGTVNDAAVTLVTDDGISLPFAEGELLFMGASGGRRSGQPWEIHYAFAASPNATNLSIGQITGIAKRGWEYLWAYYQAQPDDDARMITPKPIAAYVEQVYRTANHGLILP